MIKLIKLKMIEIFFVFSLLMTLFSGVAKDYFEYLSYADELLLGVIIIYFMISVVRKRRIIVHDVQAFLLIALFFLLGILFSYNSGLQKSSFAIFLDLYSWGKIIFVYYICYYYLENDSVDRLYKCTVFLSKIIIIIAFLLVIPNQLLNLDLGGKGSRFGIVSFAFPGMHVAFTIGFVAIMISLLLIEYRKNILWVFVAAIIGLSTARFKAFGWELFVIIYFILRANRMGRLAIIASIVGVIVSFGTAFENYFLDDTASRAMEVLAAISIMKDYFPCGVGFGTFGTTMSFKFYSDAYELYGLSHRYGYMETAGAFIGDGGWSTQLAQFGALGTAMFCIIIYKICKKTIIQSKINGNFIPAVSIISYLLLASISERIFSGDLAPYIAVVMVIICRHKTNEIRKKEKCD